MATCGVWSAARPLLFVVGPPQAPSTRPAAPPTETTFRNRNESGVISFPLGLEARSLSPLAFFPVFGARARRRGVATAAAAAYSTTTLAWSDLNVNRQGVPLGSRPPPVRFARPPRRSRGGDG